MQEDDQRRSESAGVLKGSFSWGLSKGDEGVLEQISDCDPLSHSEGTARVVPAEENRWRIALEIALLDSTATLYPEPLRGTGMRFCSRNRTLLAH
jgi:hypothetical protein